MRRFAAPASRAILSLAGILALGPIEPIFSAEPSTAKAAANGTIQVPSAPSAPTAVDSDAPDRIISSTRSSGAAPVDGDSKPRLRQREGAKVVDRRGRFEIRGDRVIFLATNPDAHFVVLENLSLERVTRVLEESGSQLEWSVSGTLTEFRASNYLQISRALVKSLPAKGEPRKLADPLATTPLSPAKTSGFTEPSSTR